MKKSSLCGIMIERTRGDDMLYIEAFHEGSKVGHAYVSIREKSLKINDFLVFDDVRVPQRFIGITYRLKKVPYRRRGVGTVLLNTIREWAAEHGIQRIFAPVTKDDAEEFPGLPSWYTRNGIEVVPFESESS